MRRVRILLLVGAAGQLLRSALSHADTVTCWRNAQGQVCCPKPGECKP